MRVRNLKLMQTATSSSPDSSLPCNPLRHCYPIYVFPQLDIWKQSGLGVFLCVCLHPEVLTEEFSARADRVEEELSSSRMSQNGYSGRV